MIKTGFLSGRFCGSFAGVEQKVDKSGVLKSVATFMTMKGKKYRFTVLGDVQGEFGTLLPFSVIVVELTDVEIGKAGEFGNYGDQNFTVTSMKLLDSVSSDLDRSKVSQIPDKKAA